MASPASIIPMLANYNPTGFALENQGKQLENQQRQEAIPLAQAQAQKAQLENQVLQRQVQDQSILSDAFRQANGDPDATFKAAVRGGISAPAAMAFREGTLKLQQAYATRDKTQLENDKALSDAKRGVYQSWLDLPAEEQASAVPGFQQRLQELDHTHQVTTNWTPDGVRSAIGKISFESSLVEDALKRAQTNEATSKGKQATAAAEKDTAEAANLKAVQTARDLTATLDQTGRPTPQGWQQFKAAHPEVRVPEGPDGLPPQAWVNSQVGLVGKPEALRPGGSLVSPVTGSTIAKAPLVPTNEWEGYLAKNNGDAAAATKEYQQAQIQRRIAEVQGTAGIEIGKQIAVQKYLRDSAGPALANVDPKLVNAATSEYTKVGLEAAHAQSAADEIKTLIDAARSGNKIAYAYAPTTGVLTINTANGVKRVNMAEIKSYSGAGSLLDRIQGWLGKQASGASIPADILNDMDAVHSQIGKNAQKEYGQKVKVINQTYNSQFKPVDFSAEPTPGQRKPLSSFENQK